MQRITAFIITLIAIGSTNAVAVDIIDTEYYAFNPNDAIYSEYVMPSVDIYAFNPKSSIYSEDANTVIANNEQYSASPDYRGAILIAPSKRITSPFNIEFSAIATTRAAYSSGLPSREGNGT